MNIRCELAKFEPDQRAEIIARYQLGQERASLAGGLIVFGLSGVIVVTTRVAGEHPPQACPLLALLACFALLRSACAVVRKRWFSRRPGLWSFLHAAIVLLVGCCMGAVATLAHFYYGLTSDALIVMMILVGMSMGVASNLVAHPALHLAFQLGTYGPPAIFLSMSTLPEASSLVMMIGLLIVFLTATGARRYRESCAALFQSFELQRQRAELEASWESARAANRAKSQFLANMSHEIRTPLNGVLGLAELILGGQLPEQERADLLSLQQSARSLLGLVNDILDFSKIEAGMLAIDPVCFTIDGLLQELRQLVEGQARRKEIELRWSQGEGLNDFFRGDVLRTRQVLGNLLTNAVKFTQRGHVALEVGLAPTAIGESATRLRFVVEDTGIGIPEDQREKVFEAFSQVDGSTTRRFGGTGLGLSISRQLAELMGGRLDLAREGPVGGGSRFVLELPVGLVGTMEYRNETAQDPEPVHVGRRLNVLVVEDNRVNQRVAVGMLQRLGHVATVAGNGKIALDLLETETPDLILMDLQMPEMDGFEATAAIRQRSDGLHTLPIIALTAHAMKGDRERALAAGFDDYLSKPLALSALANAIEVLGSELASAPGGPTTHSRSAPTRAVADG